jgi:hypothetical protein
MKYAEDIVEQALTIVRIAKGLWDNSEWYPVVGGLSSDERRLYRARFGQRGSAE